MRTIVWMMGLAAVVVAGVECKRANGAYCDDARPCPSGFACDVAARECHSSLLSGSDLAGISLDMAGCNCSNPTPICVAMQCVSCLSTSDPDGACAASSPTTPYCVTSGGNAGDCIGCRDANDCSAATAICDGNTHMCRGCIADAECPSLVCDLTPGSTTRGQCVPAANVVYADPAGSNGDGLTPATAKRKVQDAIQQAAVMLNPPRLYVRIAAATYNEGVVVNNATVYLVGATGATIHRMNAGDASSAQGAGSLTMRNLILTADNGNGANCASGSTLKIYGGQLINSTQVGVYSGTGSSLTVDGAWIQNNSGGGLSVNGDFTVINNIITNNTGAGGFTQVTAGTTMVFANNTVADNISVTAHAGVTCLDLDPGFELLNTILYNNRLGSNVGALGETNCTGSFDANDDVSAGPQSTIDLTMQPPGFKGTMPVSPDSYHLLPTSPCISEASPLGAPDHDFDFEPRPDPKTGMPDIGADEAQ